MLPTKFIKTSMDTDNETDIHKKMYCEWTIVIWLPGLISEYSLFWIDRSNQSAHDTMVTLSATCSKNNGMTLRAFAIKSSTNLTKYLVVKQTCSSLKTSMVRSPNINSPHTVLWANSADDKLIFFLLFLENRIWRYMQTVSSGDSLHVMSNPIF